MEQQKKMTVYYVEDEPDLVELCRVAFHSAGITMNVSATGEEGITFIKKIINKETQAPDAFILDILLPGVSGMDIMREIRTHAELDNIPIVIFTNYSDVKIKEEIKKTKNAEYILKTDIIPTQLVKIVLNKVEELKSKT